MATYKHEGYPVLTSGPFLCDRLAIKAFWYGTDMTAMIKQRLFLSICNVYHLPNKNGMVARIDLLKCFTL